MTTLRLINDNELSTTDFAIVTQAVTHFVPLVANAWNLKGVTVVAGGTPLKGEWPVYITEKKRVAGAAGYHDDINGVPTAYCSLAASYRIYGHYIAPYIVKGAVVHPALFTEGLVTTVCHEIAEMLCDSFIKTFSKPDAKGRQWLIEVCDHVFGSYSNYVVNGNNCILPDVTTPAFYELGAKGPYSIIGGATAPFTMTPTGYAYYKDASGNLQKV